MMVPFRTALRAVVLPAPDAYPQDTPTRRLLGQLGHDVSRANSPGHALELLGLDHTDLLVVDVTDNDGNRELLESLGELPQSKCPARVAVFSDGPDGRLDDLRRKMPFSHVHVFPKPLHMHGLLSVLRQMHQQGLGKPQN